MFLVRDSIKQREERIIGMIDHDPAIAVLMATANFEWVVRRAARMLSTKQNREINAILAAEHYHGLDKFKKLWKSMVPQSKETQIHKVIRNWDQLGKAYQIRHQLIHGVKPVSKVFATKQTKTLLAAVHDITIFCDARGIDLSKRMKVRRKAVKQ